LQAIPEFKFGFIPRDPSCLPKEYTSVEPGETCYFLDGYKHAGIDEKEELQVHIDAAIKHFNAESQN
jgi:guanylate cyclase soluble subunit alpha